MRPHLPLPIALVGSLLGCVNSADPPVFNDQRFPPSCEVVWPAEDGEILFGADVELAVSISDSDTPPEELSFRAVSDLDGVLPGEASLDGVGATLPVAGSFLREGYHTITATVSDEHAVTECATSFFVVPNIDPSVNFANPKATDPYLSSQNILVDVAAFDPDEPDQSALQFQWLGIGAVQPTAPAHPDSDGTSMWFLPRLAAGDYTIGVQVTDSVGGIRTANVTFTVIPTDADGDGHISAGDGGPDCDDSDPAVHLGHIEVCDGKDNDCDGLIDEDDAYQAPTWYVDADLDGFGDPSTAVVQCSQPSGTTPDGGDCDDTDVAVHPDADEVCDGVDNDCTGVIDDAPIDGQTFYTDADGDTFGDLGSPATACVIGAGLSADASDCNDADPLAHPSATEACGNSQDDDCDGAIDEACFFDHCGPITTATVWHPGTTHRISCPVDVESTLTILDGAVVEFAGATASLDVAMSTAGRLMVQGASRNGVTFGPSGGVGAGRIRFGPFDTGSVLTGFTLTDTGPGWEAIHSSAPQLELDHCAIADGQQSGVVIAAGAALTMTDCQVDRFVANGVSVSGRLDTFENNGFSDNILAPLAVPAREVGHIGAGNVFVGNWVDAVDVSAGWVDTDSLWPALDVPYRIIGTVDVGGIADPVLELAPGSELRFSAGESLRVGVGRPGRLVVDAASNPVVLQSRSASPQPGDWDGLTVGDYDTGTSLTGVEIWHADTGIDIQGSVDRVTPTVQLAQVAVHDSASEGVLVRPPASASVVDSAITNGRSDGLVAVGQLTAHARNIYTGMAGNPLVIRPEDIGTIDGTSTYPGNVDNRIRVTNDVLVTTDFVWPAAPIPFDLAGRDVIVSGAQLPLLTLSDGLQVHFASEGEFRVSSGSLEVEPGPGGVTLTSNALIQAPGQWKGLRFENGGSLGPQGLAGLELSYGGRVYQGLLHVDVPALGALTDVSVTHSASHGLYVAVGAEVGAVTDCTMSDNLLTGLRTEDDARVGDIHGSTFTRNQRPLHLESPELATTVHHDNQLTGNVQDAILFSSTNDAHDRLRSDTTLRNLSVPWEIASDSDLTLGGHTLTIEPGTEIRVRANTRISVGGFGSGGHLDAVGTASEPIVFTSATSTPAPGDWRYIWLATSGTGRLDHVIVEYGGAQSANIVRDAGSPFQLDRVESRNSASYGIFASGTPPDISQMTFSNNALGDKNW